MSIFVWDGFEFCKVKGVVMFETAQFSTKDILNVAS